MLKFKYFLHLIGLTLPFFCVIAWGATPISSSTKDILKQLDKTLAEETLYTQEKEKEIDQLKARLPQATEAERYSIFNGLFDAYKKYQTPNRFGPSLCGSQGGTPAPPPCARPDRGGSNEPG